MHSGQEGKLFFFFKKRSQLLENCSYDLDEQRLRTQTYPTLGLALTELAFF